MREIRLSEHARKKIELLASRNIEVSEQFVIETIQSPTKVESIEEGKMVAQRPLNDRLVLRVVYREFDAFVLAITVYPGRKSRYERN